MTVGVLALQGDVREHAAAFAALGEDVRWVREPRELNGLSGIVLPGGESTTLSLLLESTGLAGPLGETLRDGLPAFGTCAGMILLADRMLDGRDDQHPFGVIDLAVRRNGYGPQEASFEADFDMPAIGQEPLHAVFIRAPVVESVGPDVEVLAALPALPARRGRGEAEGVVVAQPVVCRQGPVLVTAFHPELTDDRRLHRLFLEMTKGDEEDDGMADPRRWEVDSGRPGTRAQTA